MNQPLELPNQEAIRFATQFGALAAEHSTTSIHVPTRLSTILEHLRRLDRAREQVKHKIRATHFIMGD
jgi:hypothetical protein